MCLSHSTTETLLAVDGCTKLSRISNLNRFIYLGFFCCLQHYIGYITIGKFMARVNQIIPLVKVLYCKLLIIGKQVPAFPPMVGVLNCQPQRWKASVLPLYHFVTIF